MVEGEFLHRLLYHPFGTVHVFRRKMHQLQSFYSRLLRERPCCLRGQMGPLFRPFMVLVQEIGLAEKYVGVLYEVRQKGKVLFGRRNVGYVGYLLSPGYPGDVRQVRHFEAAFTHTDFPWPFFRVSP